MKKYYWTIGKQNGKLRTKFEFINDEDLDDNVPLLFNRKDDCEVFLEEDEDKAVKVKIVRVK